MNIKKLKVGDKVKTINSGVDYYVIDKILKSVVWLRLPDYYKLDNLKTEDKLFKGVNPNIIKKVVN